MPLATLEELRAYAPAASSLPDAAVVNVLDAVSAFVGDQVGPLLASDFPATERVYWRDVSPSGAFQVSTRYATDVTSVNGITTASLGLAKDSDYFLDGNRVDFPDVFRMLPTGARYVAPHFTVTLAGGLTSVPKDLKLAVLQLCAMEIGRDSGRMVTSQSLGPRSVSFSDADGPDWFAAAAVIRKYAPITLL